MIDNLFTWENWDEDGFMIIRFIDCKLITKVRTWEVGTHFDTITVNFSKGGIQFRNGMIFTDFKITLNIGDVINSNVTQFIIKP